MISTCKTLKATACTVKMAANEHITDKNSSRWQPDSSKMRTTDQEGVHLTLGSAT